MEVNGLQVEDMKRKRLKKSATMSVPKEWANREVIVMLLPKK